MWEICSRQLSRLLCQRYTWGSINSTGKSGIFRRWSVSWKNSEKALKKKWSKYLGDAKMKSFLPKPANSGRNSNKTQTRRETNLTNNLHLAHQKHQSQRSTTNRARASARRSMWSSSRKRLSQLPIAPDLDQIQTSKKVKERKMEVARNMAPTGARPGHEVGGPPHVLSWPRGQHFQETN